jgi:hypothetical protein
MAPYANDFEKLIHEGTFALYIYHSRRIKPPQLTPLMSLRQREEEE